MVRDVISGGSVSPPRAMQRVSAEVVLRYPDRKVVTMSMDSVEADVEVGYDDFDRFGMRPGLLEPMRLGQMRTTVTLRGYATTRVTVADPAFAAVAAIAPPGPAAQPEPVAPEPDDGEVFDGWYERDMERGRWLP